VPGAVAQAAPSWQNISSSALSWNPSSPANNYGALTVAVDPQGNVYLGTNYQGIWRSTDGGTSWAKWDTGGGSSLIDGGRIWSLHVDPFNSAIVWAASGYGSGGPLKSTDGGVSWTQTFSTTNAVEQQLGTNDIYQVIPDPYLEGHVLASFHYYWNQNGACCFDSGLIQSFDGGNSWSVINPPAGGGWGAGNTVFFLDNSNDWLVASQSAGVWRTANGGASWTQVLTVPLAHGAINALTYEPANNTYYLAEGTSIYKSTNAGGSWTDIGQGLTYQYYEAVASDGVSLYTSPGYAGQSSSYGPWQAVAEAGGTWSAYAGATTEACNPLNGLCAGMVDTVLDRVHHIIYTADWQGGVWKFSTSPSLSPDLATRRQVMAAVGYNADGRNSIKAGGLRFGLGFRSSRLTRALARFGSPRLAGLSRACLVHLVASVRRVSELRCW
jgi:photosystem II stability/assembly factor-like uncharacterized protein